jgi:hypothetical protein
LTLDKEELGIISDFVISAEIPQIRRENDERTSDLKIEILRSCARKHLSELFANPVLDVTVLHPDFYQEDYIIFKLRIERGSNNFFVMQYIGCYLC